MLALSAYRCRTIEETRLRAQRLGGIDFDLFGKDQLRSLLQAWA